MVDNAHNLMLLERIREGDEEALEELTRTNMGLVNSVAVRYRGRGTEYEDLVQIGCIGMIKAAKSFDFSYGTTFSTYAVPLISGEIRRHLRDDGPVKVSRTLKKLGADAMKAREEFCREMGREPRISELALLLSTTEEELVKAYEAVCPVHSIYEGGQGDEEGQLLDILPDPEERFEKLIDRIALREAIKKLDDLHKQIVLLRYYKELSQEQTGKVLGISQVKVSREEKKVLAELRRQL